MIRAIWAGAVYLAVVLAAGFVLGGLRELLVAPLVGKTAAVLLELPLILAIAWVVCRAVVNNLSVAARPGPRLVMGATALILLLAAEMATAWWLLGRTPAEHLASYRSLPAGAGLIAQLAFALFPLARIVVERVTQRHGQRELT